MFFSIQLTKEKLLERVIKIKKEFLIKVTFFKKQLSLLQWRQINFNGTANKIHETFLITLTDIYDPKFPIREYILKDKDISKGPKKLSKKKQRLYATFFETKTREGEFKYKIYKNLFEKL